MSIVSIIIIVAFSIIGVASLVEYYKKNIRKGQAKSWENWIVAGVLSIIFSFVLNYCGLVLSIFASKGLPALDVAIYAVLIFFVQMYVDLKFIKAIISSFAKTIDAAKFITTVVEKLGVKIDSVIKAFQAAGITVDQVETFLREAGFPEDKIKEMLEVYINNVKIEPIKAEFVEEAK